MTQLEFLTLREYDNFYHFVCEHLHQTNSLLPQTVITPLHNMRGDSFKELMAIVLVGKGDFSNFNDSFDKVNSFLNFVENSVGSITLDKHILLNLLLANRWDQNSHSNVGLPTLFSLNQRPELTSSFCLRSLAQYLTEGKDKLKKLKFA